MNKISLTFTADQQQLKNTTKSVRLASGTVDYIDATFELGENWSDFDAVKAIWTKKTTRIATVLDAYGYCKVPDELLNDRGTIRVNLVGSVAEEVEGETVLVDRLTTYQANVLTINAEVPLDGDDASPLTPSQFEQYVYVVKGYSEDAVEAKEAAEEALTLATQEAEAAETANTSAWQASVNAENQRAAAENASSGAQAAERAAGGYASQAGQYQYQASQNANQAQAAKEAIENMTVSAHTETGTTPTVTKTVGDVVNLDFGLVTGPRGETGATGATGPQGPQGETGPKGDKGDPGEVSLETLAKVMVSDTASGAIASFADGSDALPAKSVLVTLNPKQSGSGTPSPSNVRPISGWDEVETVVSGKNLISGVVVNANIGGNGAIISTDSYDMYFAPIKKGQTYVITTDNSQFVGGYFTSEPTVGSVSYTASRITSYTKSFTAPIDGYLAFRTNSGYGTPQVELGSTATDYAPYTATTYTTDLPQTVYGGTLDVVTGKLVVDRVMVDLGTLYYNYSSSDVRFYTTGLTDIKPITSTTVAFSGLSDIYATVPYSQVNGSKPNDSVMGLYSLGSTNYLAIKDTRYTNTSDFKTAMSGVQLCYELATPTTIQCDTQTVQTLMGDNNVWGGSGVSIDYYADTKLYVEKVLGA